MKRNTLEVGEHEKGSVALIAGGGVMLGMIGGCCSSVFKCTFSLIDIN